MTKLNEYAQWNVGFYERELRDAKAAQVAILQLPEAIQELEASIGYAWVDHEGGVHISVCFSGGEDSLRILKREGSMGFISEVNTYDGKWYAKDGKLKSGDNEFSILVAEVDEPPKCHLEEYKEVVTRYRQVCEDEEGVVQS